MPPTLRPSRLHLPACPLALSRSSGLAEPEGRAGPEEDRASQLGLRREQLMVMKEEGREGGRGKGGTRQSPRTVVKTGSPNRGAIQLRSDPGVISGVRRDAELHRRGHPGVTE